ncbi:MAG: hypothetical protein K0Q85_19 [Caproiciproducens sp.]|jgi:phage terminase Nu1 subunit (DNA packaging protein)|nr:hypothetical protein [Caproiciproducens sp.]
MEKDGQNAVIKPLPWIQIEDTRLLLNSTATAEFFNISRKTLLMWERKGAPKEERGWWDIKKLMEWLGKGGSSKNEAVSDEARKLAAEAKYKEAKAAMAEMDQAVMEGKYIEKSEVDRTWAIVGTQIKANIMAWVRTLTPTLAHQDMRSVEKVMTGAVYDLLEQLSSKGRFQKKPDRATRSAKKGTKAT